MSKLSKIAQDGIWKQNPALVKLLGLGPLLAVSNSFVTALCLGIVIVIVLTTSNILISFIRFFLNKDLGIPTKILVLATLVTLADIFLQAWYFELHHRIGLFLALMVTNFSLLGRAKLFTSSNPILSSAVDGFMLGIGFLWVLLIIGSIREGLGSGTLFSDMQILLGPVGEDLEITFSDNGFLLLILPPGAFISLGILIALKNLLLNNRR